MLFFMYNHQFIMSILVVLSGLGFADGLYGNTSECEAKLISSYPLHRFDGLERSVRYKAMQDWFRQESVAHPEDLSKHLRDYFSARLDLLKLAESWLRGLRVDHPDPDERTYNII
jgi:hypothetical protein